MDLCGYYEIKHKGGIDLQSYIITNKIKLICKTLPETCRFFFKIALEVKTGKKTLSDFFLPNHENNNSGLIPLADALKYIENLLKEEKGFPASKIKQICENMNEIAEKDLYSRMLRNKVNSQEEGRKNKFISFDSFTSYLIDIFVSSMIQRLEKLHSNLVMFCKSRYESRLTFENFKYAVIILKLKIYL